MYLFNISYLTSFLYNVSRRSDGDGDAAVEGRGRRDRWVGGGLAREAFRGTPPSLFIKSYQRQCPSHDTGNIRACDYNLTQCICRPNIVICAAYAWRELYGTSSGGFRVRVPGEPWPVTHARAGTEKNMSHNNIAPDRTRFQEEIRDVDFFSTGKRLTTIFELTLLLGNITRYTKQHELKINYIYLFVCDFLFTWMQTTLTKVKSF